MPHISKRILTSKARAELEAHLFNILLDTTEFARRKIFKELYTSTERLMFAKRLGMLSLIDQKIPTHTIAQLLQVSPSTVARFELVVSREGFRETRHSLKRHKINNSFLKLFFDLASAPFKARHTSLEKLIETL